MGRGRRITIGLTAVGLGVLAVSAFISMPERWTGPDTDYIELEQGWDDGVRERMHHLGFGSRILPYDWLLHLEHADSDQLVRDSANLAALGFVPARETPLNPDGLPVGFSQATDHQDVTWAGINCAACHTGVVRYQGEQVIIEGGAALIDFPAFEQQLIDGITATLADADKFQRFADALQVNEHDGLRSQLQARLDYLRQRQQINHSDTAYGHGRLDAFGQIFNTVAVELLNQPDNARPADAPVSYPFLWDASHLDLVQWNGSAPNKTPGPLIQNVTTALAVYGTANLTEHSGLSGYPSSVNIPNLGTLQDHYFQLKAPAWPGQLLGGLKPDLVAQGEGLYQENCLACHSLASRQQASQDFKVTLVPTTEVGTDPTMANNFIQARAHTGVLEGRKRFVLAGEPFGAEATTIDMVVHAAMGATLHHPIDALIASLKDYHKVYSATPNSVPDQYKARPLNGIWATAPFLHNGSVPSLMDLLSPPEQRPAQFHLGNYEFDPARVGYDTGAGEHTTLFDTSLPGNSNQGHVYGTDLTEPQRLALVEYLKSL